MKYRTRAGSSPQGKPRVFFCAHEADHDKYFDIISNEILKLQNCAVYYKENGERADAELLCEMQLFVMPVTTKLLTSDSDALATEFNFALEHHIPVLPLMQEQGLVKMFNEKCGDLQYLDKNSHDSTAISYEQKLEKYLSSILVGDELAAKVRAAFDAYVFLSYRKKDRAYAKELMRLIHKNDFCRDIAIWYDEFLTPGENFNNSIKEALEKSGLFVLAVTPNLVNETNYIMTTEYPMAKKASKLILPAEMVETDKAELAAKYLDIPECTDAHNEAELSKTLLSMVEKIAKRENDQDPQHNFFIGLAYLGGIDVEVDHQRAVELITSAADAGLAEAMEKLVSMYRMGEGVSRDYHRAVEWQRKLVEQSKALYAADGCESNAINLFWAECGLGDYIYELRSISEAKAVYKSMLELCKEIGDRLDFRRYLSISYARLGLILQAEGKPKEAKEYYIRVLNIREMLVRESDISNNRRALAMSCVDLGDISQDEWNYEEAREYYGRAFEIYKKLVENNDSLFDRKDLSSSLKDLGAVALREKRISEARPFFEQALEMDKCIVEEEDTISNRRRLATAYAHLGDVAREEIRPVIACDYYIEAINLAKEIADTTGTVRDRHNLAILYERLGDTASPPVREFSAADHYKKSMELIEKLVSETGTVSFRRSLCSIYIKLGGLYKEYWKLSEMKECYSKALEICRALADEVGMIEDYRRLMVIYRNFGDIMKEQKELAEAERFYELCAKIAERIEEKTHAVQACEDLFILYSKLEAVARDMGNTAKAKEYCERNLRFISAAAEAKDVAELYDYWAGFLSFDMINVSESREEKLAYMQKAYDIYSMLAERYPLKSRYSEMKNIVYQKLQSL